MNRVGRGLVACFVVVVVLVLAYALMLWAYPKAIETGIWIGADDKFEEYQGINK